MASIDNFQQVKVKVDKLAQVNDILKCFTNATLVILRFAYNSDTDASYRLDDEMITTIKSKYQEIADQLWSDIQTLTSETSTE